jgi:hypothetical protein
MIRYVSAILVLVVFALGASAQTAPRSGIVQAPPVQTKLDHNKLVKPSKYSALPPRGEFQDNQIELAPDQERRQLRESRYKGNYPEVKDPADTYPTGPPEDSTYVINDYAGKVDAFPASRSAAVVVGTVLGGKAFVSKDRTYVYSDYQVRVDQVLKQDPTANLSVGGRLVASRGGGTIHFPSGRIRNFINHGEGMPAIGSQYLLFLVKPNIPEPEYEIIIGGAYELRNGKAHPLDDINTELDNVSEPEFLDKVRNAIAGVTP